LRKRFRQAKRTVPPVASNARQDGAAHVQADDCVHTRRSSAGSSVTPFRRQPFIVPMNNINRRSTMGAMRKNAKKKAKQRAHANKRRAQAEAIAAASERHTAGGQQRAPGRAS